MPSAGEVERFAYCAHNWYLARRGEDPDSRSTRRGIRQHKAMDRARRRVERDLREYEDGLRWSMRILSVAASATFLTLELVLLRAHPFHWAFLLTALVLTSTSSALLVVGLLAERRAQDRQRRAGLVPGKVARAGMDGDGPVLRDAGWDLTGVPDYILDLPHGAVPVEVKTGHTPDTPHDSHRLQLACYLRLLEVRDGAPPEYGLLNYPDGVFRVAWDDGLRSHLRTTLDRMAEAEATGRADRDHEHAGRCLGCSRRDACDQRLA